MAEAQKILLEDQAFIIAFKAEDRWHLKDVQAQDYEEYLVRSCKRFRMYYANIFVLNKVSPNKTRWHCEFSIGSSERSLSARITSS
jgi:hypothetical protein